MPRQERRRKGIDADKTQAAVGSKDIQSFFGKKTRLNTSENVVPNPSADDLPDSRTFQDSTTGNQEQKIIDPSDYGRAVETSHHSYSRADDLPDPGTQLISTAEDNEQKISDLSESDPFIQDDQHSDNRGDDRPDPGVIHTSMPETHDQKAVFHSESQNLDIEDFVGVEKTDNQKYTLLENRKPHKSFHFPPTQFREKRSKSAFRNRFCLHEWFETFHCLAYSESRDGLYCLACVLFPTPAHQGSRAKNLISIPFKNWKDASHDLKYHGVLEYHKDSMSKLKAFYNTHKTPQGRDDNMMNDAAGGTVSRNRRFLKSIIKCIEFCGRQGISLRGHRDDGLSEFTLENEGNLKSLLKLLSETDTQLKTHLESCQKNASYVSKTTQNDLLECMSEYLQTKIVDDVKSQPCGPYFGLMADEVTDSSSWEQLGIMLRYVKDGAPTEKLLQYVDCENIKGSTIADYLINALRSVGLDPKYCRSQTYDGAGNMAGKQMGAAKQFQEKVGVVAPYFHCASHSLNLALSKACKVPDIWNTVCVMKSLGIFFKYSHKHQRELERHIHRLNAEQDSQRLKTKIKPLCETRWVERHTSFTDLHDLYEPVLDCLQAITNNINRDWDTKGVSEANGLFSQLTSSKFIVSFQTCILIFGYTLSLSRLLQGESLDVIAAYSHVNVVNEQLTEMRNDAANVFSTLYSNRIIEMANVAGCQVNVPRRCSIQTLRSNVEGNTPEEYYRRSIFIPFLESLISQLSDRFSDASHTALKATFLLPSHINELTESVIKLIDNYYGKDMPSRESFHQEVNLWKRYWVGSDEKPKTIVETINSNMYNVLAYPNIHAVLNILLVTAASTAGVERSNSSLRFVKNVLRSSMSEARLNSLLLLFVHRDIPLDHDEIINLFCKEAPETTIFFDYLSYFQKPS